MLSETLKMESLSHPHVMNLIGDIVSYFDNAIHGNWKFIELSQERKK